MERRILVSMWDGSTEPAYVGEVEAWARNGGGNARQRRKRRRAVPELLAEARRAEARRMRALERQLDAAISARLADGLSDSILGCISSGMDVQWSSAVEPNHDALSDLLSRFEGVVDGRIERVNIPLEWRDDAVIAGSNGAALLTSIRVIPSPAVRPGEIVLWRRNRDPEIVKVSREQWRAEFVGKG